MSKLTLAPSTVQPLRLGGLSDWLFENGYHRDGERDVILDIVRRNRTSEVAYMCGYIDREDREIAEHILEESQPEVPYDDPAWFVAQEDFETWELGPAIPPDAVLTPPRRNLSQMVLAAAEAESQRVDWRNWERYLPPIAGGAPEVDDLGDDIPFLGDKRISEC